MNIIEAIKSGKRFRRQSVGSDWYGVVGGMIKYQPQFGDGAHAFNANLDALLADDWEIEEKRITISRSQFFEAMKIAQRLADMRQADQGTLVSWNAFARFLNVFAKELGFNET